MNVSQFLIQQIVVGENNGQLSRLLSYLAISTHKGITCSAGLSVVLVLFPVIVWAYFYFVPLNLRKFFRRLRTLGSRSSNVKTDVEVRQFQGFRTDLIFEDKGFNDTINYFHEIPFP